jgi:hypothetical protein
VHGKPNRGSSLIKNVEETLSSESGRSDTSEFTTSCHYAPAITRPVGSSLVASSKKILSCPMIAGPIFCLKMVKFPIQHNLNNPELP